MKHRITSWLESFGRHVMLNGWCDMYGTSIPPSQYWVEDPPDTYDDAEPAPEPVGRHPASR